MNSNEVLQSLREERNRGKNSNAIIAYFCAPKSHKPQSLVISSLMVPNRQKFRTNKGFGLGSRDLKSQIASDLPSQPLNRNAALLCLVSEIAGDFWGLCESQIAGNRCDFGALSRLGKNGLDSLFHEVRGFQDKMKTRSSACTHAAVPPGLSPAAEELCTCSMGLSACSVCLAHASKAGEEKKNVIWRERSQEPAHLVAQTLRPRCHTPGCSYTPVAAFLPQLGSRNDFNHCDFSCVFYPRHQIF